MTGLTHAGASYFACTFSSTEMASIENMVLLHDSIIRGFDCGHLTLSQSSRHFILFGPSARDLSEVNAFFEIALLFSRSQSSVLNERERMTFSIHAKAKRQKYKIGVMSGHVSQAFTLAEAQLTEPSPSLYHGSQSINLFSASNSNISVLLLFFELHILTPQYPPLPPSHFPNLLCNTSGLNSYNTS